MARKQHIMHGRDHCPGGADPIPCLDDLGGGHVGVPIEEAYNIAGAGLQYWYRLGEAGPFPVDAEETPDFALDSSGHNRHLSALNANDTRDGVWLTDPTSELLPTFQVEGALAGGNANDGGVRFQYNEYQWVSFGHRLMLAATDGSCQMEVDLVSGSPPAIGTGSTFAAWVAFIPVGTDPGSDYWGAYGSDGPTDIPILPFVSTWNESTFGTPKTGVYLGFQPGSGVLKWQVYSGSAAPVYAWESSFSFVPDQWYHFASSIVKLAANSYRRRIYINTNLVVELVGTGAEVGLAETGQAISLGGGQFTDIQWAHSRGKLDEVAYWTTELDQQAIDDLYNARVLNEGDRWDTGQVDPAIDIPADSLTSYHIATDAIGNDELADDAVTSANIVDGTIASADLADGSVTTPKLATGAVTDVKLAADAVTTTKLANGAVTSAKIADGTIANADIGATAAIAVSKLGAGTEGYWLKTQGGAVVWAPAPALGGGHAIADEGAVLTARSTLDFVGAGVTATDDAGADKTVVTIPGGAGAVLRMVATWQGFLPDTTGQSGAVWRVPYLDGSAVSFDLTRAFVRLETPGGSSTQVDLEKSPAGAFVASTITTLTLASGDYDEEDTSALGSVDSGELLRISWVTLGADAGTTYTVELEGVEA